MKKIIIFVIFSILISVPSFAKRSVEQQQAAACAENLRQQVILKKAKQERLSGHPNGPMNQMLNNDIQNRSSLNFLRGLFKITK